MDIFPVVTLFLGYGASYITELLRDRHATKREREARAASQQERSFERHVTFQAKTMLEMQEAALNLVQLGTELIIQWNSRCSTGDNWLGARPRDDLFNRNLLARARSEMIAARVDDATVRRIIEELQKHADGLLGSKSSEEAAKELTFMFAYSGKLNERIGEVLRQLNTDEITFGGGDYLAATKTAEGKVSSPLQDPESNSQEQSCDLSTAPTSGAPA